MRAQGISRRPAALSGMAMTRLQAIIPYGSCACSMDLLEGWVVGELLFNRGPYLIISALLIPAIWVDYIISPGVNIVVWGILFNSLTVFTISLVFLALSIYSRLGGKGKYMG